MYNIVHICMCILTVFKQLPTITKLQGQPSKRSSEQARLLSGEEKPGEQARLLSRDELDQLLQGHEFLREILGLLNDDVQVPLYTNFFRKLNRLL